MVLCQAACLHIGCPAALGGATGRAMESQSPYKRHSLAVTLLSGKPECPFTLCGAGAPHSFSMAFSLTFNENKRAGMGRGCRHAAWPCAGHWLCRAASAAEALQKAGRSWGGAGSDAFPWGEATSSEKPGSGPLPMAATRSGLCLLVRRAEGHILTGQGSRHDLHASS